MRYPGSYARAWGPGNGRHAAIGALIGFGIGAALGAKANNDPHPGVTLKASLLVGFIGSGLGAAIASGVPPPFARNLRRRGPWPGKRRQDRDNDEDQLASQSKSDRPEASE
jgi:hypothetical protein